MYGVNPSRYHDISCLSLCLSASLPLCLCLALALSVWEHNIVRLVCSLVAPDSRVFLQVCKQAKRELAYLDVAASSRIQDLRISDSGEVPSQVGSFESVAPSVVGVREFPGRSPSSSPLAPSLVSIGGRIFLKISTLQLASPATPATLHWSKSPFSTPLPSLVRFRS